MIHSLSKGLLIVLLLSVGVVSAWQSVVSLQLSKGELFLRQSTKWQKQHFDEIETIFESYRLVEGAKIHPDYIRWWAELSYVNALLLGAEMHSELAPVLRSNLVSAPIDPHGWYWLSLLSENETKYNAMKQSVVSGEYEPQLLFRRMKALLSDVDLHEYIENGSRDWLEPQICQMIEKSSTKMRWQFKSVEEKKVICRAMMSCAFSDAFLKEKREEHVQLKTYCGA